MDIPNAAVARLLAVDFEACGLGPGTWPVEIGVSGFINGGVQTYSTLIKPDPSWDQSLWSSASEQVHGISRSALDIAPAARSILPFLRNNWADIILFSDAPEHDQRWLDRLAELNSGLTLPRIQDFDAVAATFHTGLRLDAVYEKLERIKAPHRAGPDAARLMRAVMAGFEDPAIYAGPGRH